jgi:hypothetical protein
MIKKQFQRNGFWAGAALFLTALLYACGFFESAFSPIEAGSTTLEGRVMDSITGIGLPGAAITLGGRKDTVIYSDSNGNFDFSIATTGGKTLTVEAAGYVPETLSLDLMLKANQAGDILLQRNNAAPSVGAVTFPVPGSRDLPLTIRFRWSVNDSDFLRVQSAESLWFYFYFGKTRSPALFDSGLLIPRPGDSGAFSPDTFFLNGPDTTLTGLDPASWYYWRIKVKDLAGDSGVRGVDSFRTRAAFSPCTTGMALVENGQISFCIDRFEMSNLEYEAANVDPLRTDSTRPSFSNKSTTPATEVTLEQAFTACGNLGKRLCYADEWQAAVSGYRNWPYPYGAVYDSSKCHTEEGDFSSSWEADSVGAWDSCVSTYGVYDLSGNVAEWIHADKNTPLPYKWVNQVQYYFFIGGYWQSRQNSSIFSIDSLVPDNGDFRFNIGFRCCKNAQ